MSSLKQVGYGAMVNSKPAGIWPVPLDFASAYMRRRQAHDKAHVPGDHTYEIVTVFIGAAVPPAPAETADAVETVVAPDHTQSITDQQPSIA